MYFCDIIITFTDTWLYLLFTCLNRYLNLNDLFKVDPTVRHGGRERFFVCFKHACASPHSK